MTDSSNNFDKQEEASYKFEPNRTRLVPYGNKLLKISDKEIEIVELLSTSSRGNVYKGLLNGEKVIVQEAAVGSEFDKYLKFKSELFIARSAPFFQKIVVPYSVADKRSYLVLEYLDDIDTLEKKIQEGISLEQVLICLLQLSQALRNLHDQEVVFTSLSPDKIVCSKPIKLKNADSLAKIGEKPIFPVFIEGFSAPEVASDTVSPETDIYSVGAIFYYAVTKKKIDNISSIFNPNEIKIPGVPQLLANTLCNKENRYPTATHLFQALLSIKNELSPKFSYEENYHSSVGLNIRRLNNEDHIGVLKIKNNDLNVAGYFVADGMGGLLGGEIASKTAVSVVTQELFKFFKDGGNQDSKKISNVFKLSVSRANDEIIKEAQNKGIKEMGTTFTGLLIVEGKAFVAHVGDSRCYLYRDNELIQLTEDHSLVQILVNNGEITKEEARTHPNRNVITKSLGTLRNLPSDYVDTLEKTLKKPYLEVKDGDIFLLFSDGVWDLFGDEELLNIIRESNEDIANIGRVLYKECLNRGASDNFSWIIVRVQVFNPVNSLPDENIVDKNRTIEL